MHNAPFIIQACEPLQGKRTQLNGMEVSGHGQAAAPKLTRRNIQKHGYPHGGWLGEQA